METGKLEDGVKALSSSRLVPEVVVAICAWILCAM